MSTLGSSATASVYVPTDPAAREVISRQLDPGENLLWAGRPNLLGVSIYAMGLGFSWMLALLIGTHKQVVLISVIAPPLCAISLFIQAGIFYGVSDRRVLWITTRPLGKKLALDAPLCDEIGAPLKIARLPLGILSFKTAAAQGHNPGFAFFLGSRAPAVHQITVAAQRKLVDEAEQAAIAALKTKPS